ncbi:type II toxin-antitoxin system VapB family antitoxin [Kingella kingae]|uniref:antitoxin n=1 Tax=Kingella kingae TaxID=504 RepID=UPI0002EC2462|nr:type II toxin-antitoxin system VapB family antitoxin [Kingella kingae]MDK4554769.1 type II toxin-antitoxin system VapB family antitoxin [Kingella kingae]MDK4575731.1 type II toxin-antitoxin system VapB family antitoxin [Kingella kingae]MDK4581715.1 type II toxin-antitoxin system VapB family antitoxin [Kingella kingae]MDK4583840.1 type II toxin-antitoxin system VapB family antitoxin [Kingella kingae]MDK4587809.1 type II toxin-antitoxin system VapB family antitoxin [Kingella kingae]
MTTAKLFWNGNSQAVRLPKEFRFMGNMVNIRKQGRQVIIEPIETDWAWLDDLGEPAPTWAQAIAENRHLQVRQLHKIWF